MATDQAVKRPMTPEERRARANAASEHQNMMARNAIFAKAKPIFQQVGGPRTVANPATGNNVITNNPLQVGFLRRFVVTVTGTITNTGAGTLTLTPNGAANLLSNVTFNDFTGNPRHNASGRAFTYVEAAKYRRLPGAALTSDSVTGFGSVIASQAAPATIANAGNGTVTFVYEIPVMVDTGRNMAGGLWLGVNNQSTLLNVTVNPTAVVTTGTDPLNAIYTGTSGTLTNVTVAIYQDYWTNVPKWRNPKNGEIEEFLPMKDLSTAYMITETASGITFAAGQQSFWNYPTFSEILGTYFAYDNGGTTLNAGTDLTQISLSVSNYQLIKQYSPNVIDRFTRDIIGSSFPKGQYALITRQHTLDVTQYPSLQLGITPNSAPASTYALVTTELLRRVQFLAAASGVGGS